MFEGKTASAQEIFQACSAMPFLAEKRYTLVKDFLSEAREEEKTAMAEFLEKIPDSSILVFSEHAAPDRRGALYKRIQKFGKLMEFPALTGGKLLGWIQKKVEAAGGTIEKEAVITLSELAGWDLFRLENEIAKLAGYAHGRPITKRDIELLVDIQLTTSIFRLTDSIGQRNQRAALETLHQLIDSGEDLHRVLYMIMRQFRIITQVKDLHSQGLSQGAMVAKLKEHPFVVSNTVSQTRNFSFDQLKRAYELLISIDTKLKSGGIKILAGDNREFVLALDRLVLDLCA
jgi:DNA polymerase-3 subunit delta